MGMRYCRLYGITVLQHSDAGEMPAIAAFQGIIYYPKTRILVLRAYLSRKLITLF